MLNVGFIGMGLLGTAISERLLKANINLFIWNRTLSKCKKLIELGAIQASTPKELANHSDIILICITDENAVESILFGEEGILDSYKKKHILIDHSTISAIAVENIVNRLKNTTITYIDAPVTGSTASALNGSLLIFAGGDKDAIEKAKPILSLYSKRIHYMGKSGNGQITKICNQTVAINLIIAIYEMISLAKQQGLDPASLIEIFEDSLFDSKAWRIFGYAAITNSTEKIATIKNVLKDLIYIKNAGQHCESPVYLTDASIKIVQKLISDGKENEDIKNILYAYNSQMKECSLITF